MSIVIQGKTVDFVCINVWSNSERRSHMEENATKRRIPMRFFKAITPATLHNAKNHYQEKRTRLWLGRSLAQAEQACCLSHISVWEEFLASKNDHLIVFEDDVEIAPHFMEIVSDLLVISPTPPDFIKLSGFKRHPMTKKRRLCRKYHLFLNAYGPNDAAGYALSKEGARKMTPYCKKMFLPIDNMMDRSYGHGIPCHSVLPYPVQQNGKFESQIKKEVSEKAREKRFDHDYLHLKIGYRLLHYNSSLRRRIATIRLLFS